MSEKNKSIKKITGNKVVFPNEEAVTKVVYLALREASKKWTSRLRNRAMIYSQLMIYYEDRLSKYL